VLSLIIDEPVTADRCCATRRLLDAAGLVPLEAPFRVLAEMLGMCLRAHHKPSMAAAAPVLLIVLAPIKRSYMWDLHPDVSVIRHCLRRGIRVYLVEWLDPGPAEDGLGLADHAEGFLLAVLDVIAAEAGEPAAVLAGHSLGGTFAAVFVLLHPERVRGLALIDAPLALAVAAGPPARLVRAMVGGPRASSHTACGAAKIG
jgi:polyhydroxyalkanoate synthase subunit PhaC